MWLATEQNGRGECVSCALSRVGRLRRNRRVGLIWQSENIFYKRTDRPLNMTVIFLMMCVEKVLRRDGYKCTKCGWSHTEWNPSDPRHLEPHHIEHYARGGKNVASNLRTLCNVCHDQIHKKERR